MMMGNTISPCYSSTCNFKHICKAKHKFTTLLQTILFVLLLCYIVFIHTHTKARATFDIHFLDS